MSKLLMGGAMAAILLASASSASAEDVASLDGRPGEPTLLVRHEPGPGPSVLYVHGATFPSGLSVAYRIDGRSWMDDLRARGFDVWAFDFAGFGGSDRRPNVKQQGAATQIGRVVEHALIVSGHKRLSILAHSWGTIPAGAFAARRPDLVERLILFGPVALRNGPAKDEPAADLVPVSIEDQWNGFQSGLPSGQASLIARPLFETWARDYLASDPGSLTRTPPVVIAPAGPQRDIAAAWSGHFPYDPAGVRAPTLLVHGEWDAITRPADAAWLGKALTGVPGGARDMMLPRGGHRMHLEENRQSLFDAVGAFLMDSANKR
ncbi:pimeloyl-ACP methyl ester carboxylesterase [Sphingomonas sp. UYAg733]